MAEISIENGRRQTLENRQTSENGQLTENEPLLGTSTHLLQYGTETVVSKASSFPWKWIRFRMEGPDGGRAFIVALAACIINFIMAGLGRQSGILFIGFIDFYRVDRKTASIPISVQSSARNLLGPIVGILGQKYGVRNVTVVGGCIYTLSAVLCFFATDIIWITIFWGVLGGVGTALTVTLTQVVIGQYFEKHKTSAAGMAFSGGCVGGQLFPFLVYYLMRNYGIQGTFLLMGAIIMHTIPAGMILRRPPWLTSRKEDVESVLVPNLVVSSTEESCNLYEGNEMRADKANLKCNSAKIRPNVEFLRQNSVLVGKILTEKTPVYKVVSDSVEVDQNKMFPNTFLCILEEMEDIFRGLQIPEEHSQFHENLTLANNGQFRGVLQKDLKSIGGDTTSHLSLPSHGPLRKSKSLSDLSKRTIDTPRNSFLKKLKDLHFLKAMHIVGKFPEEEKLNVLKVSIELRKLYIVSVKVFSEATPLIEPELQKITLSNEMKVQHTSNNRKDSFLDHIKTAINLHMKPMFVLICICRVIHFISFMPVTMIILDYIKDKGLQPSDGSWGLVALSTGDLIGRTCFGWVTDSNFLSMDKFMMIAMVIHGVSTASLTMVYNRESLFVCLAVFGLLLGSVFVRQPVLVSKYMESHEQSIAMGCINFFSGVLGFALPAYIGFFRDSLHCYDYIFYINGALSAAVGLSWALEPYFQRCSSQQQTIDELEII